jgi:hypothetical protein
MNADPKIPEKPVFVDAAQTGYAILALEAFDAHYLGRYLSPKAATLWPPHGDGDPPYWEKPPIRDKFIKTAKKSEETDTI